MPAVRLPSEPSSFPSGDMLDLLKWRAHPERINDSLSKLRDIDGSEIVKVEAFLSASKVVELIRTTALLCLSTVSPGHSGHPLWYFGRKLSEIWTQGL